MTLSCFRSPIVLALLLASSLPGRAWAQATSPADGITPLAMTPGSPAGSFALSGFENVNLFNGNLSFHLPLLHIGGRGEAGYTMTLTIERRVNFRFDHKADQHDTRGIYRAESNWFSRGPGLSPGVMSARTASQEARANGETALTRLTFTGADGTEYEFRDTVYGGRPRRAPSDPNPTSRGRTFEASDGSAARYVGDQEIKDQPGQPLAGWLYLRSGTRYRLDNFGRVTRILDRNGNTIDVLPGNRDVSQVTDSLGRVVTVNSVEDAAGLVRQDINYKGSRGLARQITIHYDDLGNVLAGPTLCEGNRECTCGELFPRIQFGAFDRFCNPRVVSYVELPNVDAGSPDQRTRYDFRYNPYGELAQVELPTGGAFEYEWESGTGSAGGVIELPFDEESRMYGWALYRRVNSRKVFNWDGDPPEQWTDYSACPSQGGVSCFQATHRLPNGTPLGREEHYFHGQPTDSYLLQPCDYPDPLNGREAYSRIYDGNAQDWVRQVSQEWEEGAPIPCSAGQDCSSLTLAANMRLRSVVTQLDDHQQAKVDYGYDDFNNVTSKREFDYGAQAPLRTTETTYVALPPYVEARLVSLPASENVSDPGGLRSQTNFKYDEGDLMARPGIVGWTAPTGPRGNLTRTIRHLDLPRPGESPEVVTERKYDQAGNVWRIKDPLGRETTIFYEDDFGVPNGRLQEESGRNTFAFPTLVRNALRHETRMQYDYYTGKVVDQADANGTVTSLAYDDPLDRLTFVTKAANPGYDRWQSGTGFRYQDGRWRRKVQVNQDKNEVDDGSVHRWVDYDPLGREFGSTARAADEDNAKDVSTETTYDARGRVAYVSQPHFASGPQLWTLAEYDILDRPVKVTTTWDNAAVVTSYSGNMTTVSDQAGRARQSFTDALGRLTLVVEDPSGLNYQTGYGYNGLDQLTAVAQGSRARSFTYDTLGRLRVASNPESGTIRYEYDHAGNLEERTDARGVKTVTLHDSVNRPWTRTYNDGTPGVTFTYDEPVLGTHPIGRLTRVGNAFSETAYRHDPLGRVFQSVQTMGQVKYGFSYGYDRQDNLVSEQYPSSRVVRTPHDNQNRISGVLDSSRTYASNFSYSPHGAPTSLRLGNGLWEGSVFNGRFQPTLVGLGTGPGAVNLLSLQYEYWPEGAPQRNNGNVFKQTIGAPGATLTQAYLYDGANRLEIAQEGAAWRQKYGYDRYGNRAVVEGNVIQPGLTPTSVASHFDALNRVQLGLSQYDYAGNQLADPLGRVSTYDGENRQATTNGGGTTYGYDGEGRRVFKTVEGQTTYFVYDAFGRLAAEYGGKAPATGTRYLTQDPLGSVRIVTDASATVVARRDYLPFGEEIPASWGGRASLGGYGTLDAIRQRFAGKERDSESGLDYFGARYFSAAQGRFTSADPRNAGADISNPQSWNAYAYTLNDPLKYVDPDGESATLVGGLLGGVFGGAGAVIRGALSGEMPTGRQIAAAAAGGAVTGAMLGSVIDTGGASLPVLLAGGALAGAAGTVTSDLVAGQQTTTGGLAEGAAHGMVGAAMMAPALSSTAAGVTGDGAQPSVQGNKATGDAFRDELANGLRQEGRDVKTEVTKQTFFGPRRLDLEVSQNGKVLGGVETKVGNSRYLPSQRAKDWYLENIQKYRVDFVRKPKEPEEPK